MDYSYLKTCHYNLFYMFSHAYINSLYKKINLLRITYLIIRYVCRAFKNFFLYLLSRIGASKSIKNKITFFVLSKNNFDALKPIYNILKSQSILLGINKRYNTEVILAPLFIPLFLSWFYVPKFFFFYYKATSEERKILTAFFPDILLSLAYHPFCKIYLRLISPKSIVFTNDHRLYTRILVDIAEKKGIKCFLCQHASVTEISPKIFSSYALLEGRHAKEKYLNVGSDEKKIKLIGIPKLDKYLKYINNNKLKTLGICTTLSMNKETIINMIHFLRNLFPDLKLIFRAHPRENVQEKYKEIVNLDGLEISNSKIIDAFSFLKKVDAIISGNSSILLEAALLNVFPIYYFKDSTTKWKDQLYDKYGYIKNKIAYQVDDLESLKNLLRRLQFKKPFIRNNTKYYCDTVGTIYEGKSAVLAANFIKKIID